MNIGWRWTVALGIVVFALGLLEAVPPPESQGTKTMKVDHATVCGSDLGRLEKAFADIGLKPDYGGPHANGVTQMSLVGFRDGSYLELIAPQKAGLVKGATWEALMAAEAGPCAWAVGTNDVSQEAGRLKGLNIPIDGPLPGSRKKPNGEVIEWVTAQAGTSTPGATLPFIIEDRTPRERRVQASASVKDTELTGIGLVVVGVKDLDSAIAMFRRAYGWTEPVIEPHPDFGAKLAHFPGTPVVLASPPAERRTWLTDRLRNLGESPVTFLLGTKNFAAAEKQFHLTGARTWFGHKVGWFDMAKLHGMRLGVVEY